MEIGRATTQGNQTDHSRRRLEGAGRGTAEETRLRGLYIVTDVSGVSEMTFGA